MASSEKDDKTYAEASPQAMGRMMALMFLGMIEGGMEREEALVVMQAYVSALALRPPEPKEDQA